MNDENRMRCCDLSRRDILLGAVAGGGLWLAGGLAGCARQSPAPASAPPASSKSIYRFPEGFLWGAGTSGLQHEGSPLADGAGPSSMYRWAHMPKKQGATADWSSIPVDTFDVSADFYRRYKSDIQLMRELGFNAYNFEVYWPRIQPNGRGAPNEKGLAFYDALVDEFLKAGIAPLCNLYVFDHPATLQDRGGWLNRDMASWFADYSAILYRRLGDRVKYWTTICELPIVSMFLSGSMLPPPKDPAAHLRATHHLLLGQGMAVQAFRASGAKAPIGNQHLYAPTRAASDSEEDVAAAKRVEAQTNGLLLESQIHGAYPQVLIEAYGKGWPSDAIKAGDMEKISAPIDFFGLDYYYDQVVRHDSSEDGGPLQAKSEEKPTSADGMHETLTQIHQRYKKLPIFILEVGDAVEQVSADGKVEDPARIEYLRRMLIGAHRAISEGVDVRSCFVWSLLDGWEFGFGLTRRYGLIHVDRHTLERTLKPSAEWYRGVIAANGFELTPEEAAKQDPRAVRS